VMGGVAPSCSHKFSGYASALSWRRLGHASSSRSQ
jgi:hypothetical protein